MHKMLGAEDKPAGSLPKEMAIATPQIAYFHTPPDFKDSMP